MSRKMLNLTYHVLQNGAEFQTSGYKEPDRPDHAAIDIISKAGLPTGQADKVVAPFPGKVTEIRNTIPGNSTVNTTGNYVIVDYGNGFQGRSYHLKQQSVAVHVGQQVKMGDVLGMMGYTGHSIPEGPEGTHLHFELRKDGVKIDPTPYLMGQKVINGTSNVTAPPAQPTKTVAEVAKEILAGTNNWGNGLERVNKLKAKGYNPQVVQAEVNRLIRERKTVVSKPVEPVPQTIKVGSVVKMKPGSSDYSGSVLRAFLFARKYKVSEIKGDRAVLKYGNTVVAAMKVSNLELVL